jgi:hypothetical protein
MLAVGKILQHGNRVIADRCQPQPLLPDRIQISLQLHELRFAERSPVGRAEKDEHRSFRASDGFQGLSAAFLILSRKIWHPVSNRRAGLDVLAVKNGKREYTQSA